MAMLVYQRVHLKFYKTMKDVGFAPTEHHISLRTITTFGQRFARLSAWWLKKTHLKNMPTNGPGWKIKDI